MIEKESIPSAPQLIESMRSIGYSFETAIADLVDNSISANATRIDIMLTPGTDPKLIIFDNGCGMNESELEEALRYGSKNPIEERADYDLGRFGLGLKSASLSQCRKLIVVSKKNNKISCFSWDIDLVYSKRSWTIIQYSNEEINKLPMINLFDNVDSGTYVLLQNFDRISSSTNNIENTITNYMANTIEHLALVFHRFLEKNIKIYVNNKEIEPLDPFLSSNKATQVMREQSFIIDNEKITLQPYILPHFNKLTIDDIKKVGGKDNLKNNQGFYIYRNKRLIVSGTWFRLARKEELGKLARIKVDIPSSLDYMWGIDIKKSSVNLPDLIKQNLYSAIYGTVFKSKVVHEYRGRKVNNDINYIWDRIETRDKCYTYKINRDIPQLKMLETSLNKEQLKLLSTIIENIEDYFPIQSLYLDEAKGNINFDNDEDIDTLLDEIKTQIDFCKEHGINSEIMLKELLSSEPYCNYDELKEKLKTEVVE